MRIVIALLAFATLAGFLAVLLFRLPRVDLICLVAITLVLAGWDVILTLREHRD